MLRSLRFSGSFRVCAGWSRKLLSGLTCGVTDCWRYVPMGG